MALSHSRVHFITPRHQTEKKKKWACVHNQLTRVSSLSLPFVLRIDPAGPLWHKLGTGLVIQLPVKKSSRIPPDYKLYSYGLLPTAYGAHGTLFQL